MDIQTLSGNAAYQRMQSMKEKAGPLPTSGRIRQAMDSDNDYIYVNKQYDAGVKGPNQIDRVSIGSLDANSVETFLLTDQSLQHCYGNRQRNLSVDANCMFHQGPFI